MAAAERLAAELGVPAELRESFAELYDAQGEASARQWRSKGLGKVRSTAEVARRIDERPELLAGLVGDDAVARARERLIFCGRYSAKVGTPLDVALDSAAEGMRLAAEMAVAAGGRGKLGMVIRSGVFGDEHLACRGRAFPYKPACSASHGAPVLEARATGETPAAAKGALLGYLAMQGGDYADDLSVEPAYHGQRVASALLAGAAELVCAGRGGGPHLTLDVRAANTPALALYQALGFTFGPNRFPGFLDWDGGFEGRAEAEVVRKMLPPNAVLEL